MRLGVAVAVVLFGCGSSRLRAEYEAAPVRVAVPEPDAEPGPARDSIVEGDVRDDQTHEPVVGCTVVVVASATGHEEVGITDEDGRFRVAVPAGPIEVTFFLNALKVTAGGSLVASPAEPIRVGQELDHDGMEAPPLPVPPELVMPDGWSYETARDCTLETVGRRLLAGQAAVDCGSLPADAPRRDEQRAFDCVQRALVQQQPFTFVQNFQGIDSEGAFGLFVVADHESLITYAADYDSDTCGGSCPWISGAGISRCRQIRVLHTSVDACRSGIEDCLRCDDHVYVGACKRGSDRDAAGY